MAETVIPPRKPTIHSPVILYRNTQYEGEYLPLFKEGEMLNPKDYTGRDLAFDDSGLYRWVVGSMAIKEGWRVLYYKDNLNSDAEAGVYSGNVPVTTTADDGNHLFAAFKVVRTKLGDQIVRQYRREHDPSRVPDRIGYAGGVRRVVRKLGPYLIIIPLLYLAASE